MGEELRLKSIGNSFVVLESKLLEVLTINKCTQFKNGFIDNNINLENYICSIVIKK